jgi:glucokinase
MIAPYAIGIDIGATNVKSVVVTPTGQILAQDRFATVDSDSAWLSRVKSHVAGIESSRGTAEWIGIGSPGLASSDSRSIAWMQGRLGRIQGLDWTNHLGRDRVVPVLNDAHAALLGEIWQGAAKGARNAVLLTLGTGVGGAIVCDGRLLQGHIGRAGHLGHLTLDPSGALDIVNTPGSLEDAIGDHTVLARSEGRFASTADLVAAHGQGSHDAARIWHKSIQCLAAAMASIINLVDPEVIIVGGGIAQAGAALFDPLAAQLDRFEWRPHGHAVRIVPAALGELAGALGAARHAMLHHSKELS